MTANSSPIVESEGLSSEALDYLTEVSENFEFADGAFIVQRGEPGRFFYVVLKGSVEVRLAAPDGASLPLTRLDQGATFGEMALIRREPVSADVVAVGAVRLLACSEADFKRALAECEELRMQLLVRLAGDLQRTTSEAWHFFQRAEALRLLIRCEERPEQLVTESASMRKLAHSLQFATDGTGPHLITGEPGTGKLLVARTLHESMFGRSAPLIIVDCYRLRIADARRLLLGPPGVDEAKNALRGLGALDLARGGSLVLKNVETLEPSLQAELAQAISSPRTGAAHLIATMRSATDSGPGATLLHQKLEVLFRNSTLHVPPLRNRRRDIVGLASLFLQGMDAENLYFAKNAENTLLSMDFQQGNVTQLRETVEFAARCTDGRGILSDHIFSGLETGEKDPGLDLGSLKGLRILLQEHSLTAIRATVLVSFLAAIGVCLAAPRSLAGQASNAFIWEVWEPAVFALFLLAGSVWCTVCPLSTAGRMIRRLFSLERQPPEWLKRMGPYLMIAGFLLIVLAERVFHMVDNPSATAVLLLSLVAAPMVLCAVFTREVWCRHVCPLGALATSLAPAAVLEIGARHGVCTSACTSHSCYKGKDDIPGCTVFHHPANSAESHHCKLCLDCLKSCPNDSAKLFLRPPLVGVWKLGSSSGTLAPFAVSLWILSLVFLAAQTGVCRAGTLRLTMACLAAFVAGIALSRSLPALLSRGKGPEPPPDARAANQVAFALAVLGWGPLMAYQIGNIPALSTLTLEPATGSIWSAIPSQEPWTLLAVLQVLFIVAAGVLAAITIARAYSMAERRGALPSPAGWFAVCFAGAASVVAAVALVW